LRNLVFDSSLVSLLLSFLALFAVSVLMPFSLEQLNEHSSIFDLAWRMILTSIGQGLFQAPNSSALLGAAPRDLQGSASGFLARLARWGRA
jgi:hypothetical protein